MKGSGFAWFIVIVLIVMILLGYATLDIDWAAIISKLSGVFG